MKRYLIGLFLVLIVLGSCSKTRNIYIPTAPDTVKVCKKHK